jgi:hypothetical protein
MIDDVRLAEGGEAGTLLLELASERAAELERLMDAGELRAERVTELVVRG